jgi:hypothetical protein
LGSLEVGDIDAWVFSANTNESIVARMGEIDAGLSPYLRLYGPSGALVDSAYGAVAAEVSTRATNSGTFLLLAGDLSSGYGGAGNYRLTLAKTGTPALVSAGDEGGGLTGTDSVDGTIDRGDLDLWTFSARTGDILSISVTESVSGSPLTPQVRLYGRDGTLLKSASGAATAQLGTLAAPTNGTYLLVIGDLSSGYAGTGTYRVTVNGLSDTLKFYAPIIARENVKLLAVGGVPGDSLTLITTTNVITPLNLWTPLSYPFDQFGVADVITEFGSAEPRRFFRLASP